jgi:CubicO group peptidase (beta-lactamase class C family)
MRVFLAIALSLAFLGTSGQAWATWSIVAVDPKTREVGVAGASCTPYVSGIAALVPGKGANVSQAMSNPLARNVAQTLLAQGKNPKEILKVITRPEFDPLQQQYGIVALGFEKDSAGYTGTQTDSVGGHFTGFGVSVQGNTLADQKIPRMVLEAYEKAAKDPKLRLSDRLLIALEAGSALGGDRRCHTQTARSAFLMVAKPEDTHSDMYLSLQILDVKEGGPNPVKLLREEYRKWQKYAKPLDPFITQILRAGKTPGLAIGVVEKGRLIYARGVGEMITGIPDYPVTPRILFPVSAAIKPMVATAVLQLVEQGKVELDTPVVRYLPYFRLKDERYRLITVRQMLTHTAGMREVEDYRWDKPDYDEDALERYVRRLQDQDLLWEPGERGAISNMAYNVLGDLVAKVSGKSFENYVETHLLRPLGMGSTTLRIDQVNPENRAAGYTMNPTGAIIPVAHYPDNRVHTPSSLVYSNMLDMTKWVLVNLNRGELNGHRILKESSYDILWRPLRTPSDVAPGRLVGMGWFLKDRAGEVEVLNDGYTEGFQSALRLLPARKIGVVVIVNINSNQAAAAEVADEALRVALSVQ